MTNVSFAHQLQPDKAVACQDCEWTGKAQELEEITDIQERIFPGEIVPAGQCPECGACAHLDETQTPDQIADELCNSFRNVVHLVRLQAEQDTERRIDEITAAEARMEQLLAQALGCFPWYKDDQDNFPDATEDDGVCVGDLVLEDLAQMAASWIKRHRALAEIAHRCARDFSAENEVRLAETVMQTYPRKEEADGGD